jgi:ABC-type Fe3+/spermidine/putrescine transport system ATPase subunit
MSEFDVVLEHVSKTYRGGARAVIDFSAELKHGEFVAMLGPSGCGKTTTLRMIGGREGRHRPTAGAARYLDDVSELRSVSSSHGFPER